MARAYVLGAGASIPIYPSGVRLLDAIEEHLLKSKEQGRAVQWAELKKWLETNSDPLLNQAHLNRNIEQLLTVLDLAEELSSESLTSVIKASKVNQNAVSQAVENHDLLNAAIGKYRDARTTVLQATEDFFIQKHWEDLSDFKTGKWDILKRFGKLITTGDTLITFNYDSTIERVLLDLKMWTPSDGYGVDLRFQQGVHDETPLRFARSKVKTLHLHGAAGWYSRPAFKPNFEPIANSSGFISRTEFSGAPLQTEICIDPLFLQGLDIIGVDAALPRRKPGESQVLLHPSFLKTYGGNDSTRSLFSDLWKMAADALKMADEVVIIGYSLPPADSAAWTLLHTSCDRDRTVVVNPDKEVLSTRYSCLSKGAKVAEPMTLEQWLVTQ